MTHRPKVFVAVPPKKKSKVKTAAPLIVGVALMSAWGVGSGGDTAREIARGGHVVATPMDEVNAAVSSERAGVSWDLPVTRNDHVDDWIGFLKGRNADKTELWLERSGRYTPMIRAELRKRGMPEDLIYLAFIESGYSPNAHSHAAAVGLWQFIAETGKRYGLEVNSYVDERRDPIKSTGAALDYLQELYDRFGSWYLAAASYNTGENRVARIMRETTGFERGTDQDFWRIAGRLPAETRNYVPLMLAAGHIGKEPEKYGFVDVDYHEPLAYTTVNVPSRVPLAAVAKATGVTEAIIEGLNPELVQDQTPPTRDWNVRVPVGTEQLYAANFATAFRETGPARPKMVEPSVRLASARSAKYAGATTTYRVKSGETLSEIAQRFGTNVRALTKANGGLLPSRLKAGQIVRVPTNKSSVKTVASKSSSSARFHRVRSGENLSVIANRYDVSTTRLKQLNGLRSSTIKAGQRIRVS